MTPAKRRTNATGARSWTGSWEEGGSRTLALRFQIVRELGLEGRVSMPGFVADIGAQMDRARCFALSSRREAKIVT